MQIYVVAEKDNLTQLAKQFYGQSTADLIERIYSANRPALKDLRDEYSALVSQTRRARAFATIASVDRSRTSATSAGTTSLWPRSTSNRCACCRTTNVGSASAATNSSAVAPARLVGL